jgi:hypothetical protein
VVGAVRTAGVAGATVGADVCVVGNAGAEVAELLVVVAGAVGAVGAVGAIVADGVTELEVPAEEAGVVALDAGVVVSTGTVLSSTVLAANSAWLVFQAKLETMLTNAVAETPRAVIRVRRAGCGFRFMINHHPRHHHRRLHRRRHRRHHRRRRHWMDSDFRIQPMDCLMQ